jgi:hypothetical protein
MRRKKGKRATRQRYLVSDILPSWPVCCEPGAVQGVRLTYRQPALVATAFDLPIGTSASKESRSRLPVEGNLDLIEIAAFGNHGRLFVSFLWFVSETAVLLSANVCRSTTRYDGPVWVGERH